METMDIRDVQERWIDNKNEYDELERKEWATAQEKSAPPDDAGDVVDIDDEEDDEEEELANYIPTSGVTIVRRS